MSKIGIIDYGMGNLGSVVNASRFIGLPAEILTRPDEIPGCDGIVLPGVGAFGDCLQHLRDHGFVEPLREWIAADRPFLGICVGLQALFESSEESPGVEGIGAFRGVVRRFADSADLKVPQMGWNNLHLLQPESSFFRGIREGDFVYFVHSYYVDPADRSIVAAETSYGIAYASAVSRGNLLAVQFHPEKSQNVGLTILRNFAAIALPGSPA
jgi:imidazole glycerol phosphate synthase glutamine amidotransferase subunit